MSMADIKVCETFTDQNSKKTSTVLPCPPALVQSCIGTPGSRLPMECMTALGDEIH